MSDIKINFGGKVILDLKHINAVVSYEEIFVDRRPENVPMVRIQYDMAGEAHVEFKSIKEREAAIHAVAHAVLEAHPITEAGIFTVLGKQHIIRTDRVKRVDNTGRYLMIRTHLKHPFNTIKVDEKEMVKARYLDELSYTMKAL